MAATCLAGNGGACGALWAIGPTAMLASGCTVAAAERCFSSASSLKLLQFLRVWDDLSSPHSFRNPCMVHGPSSCSFAERNDRVPSRDCLGHHSRFCYWGSSSGFVLFGGLLSSCRLPFWSFGKPAATMSGPLSS